MTQIVWLGFLLVGAGTALAVFTASINNWPVLGLLSLTIPALLAWELPAPPPLAVVAGSNVFGYDVIAIAFAVIAVRRRAQLREHLGKATPWLLVLLALLAISILRGLAINDLGSTVNDARSFLYLGSTFAWSMSLNWARTMAETQTYQLRWLQASVLLMAVIAIYHFTRSGIGDPNIQVDAVSGLEQTSRVLVSGQALLVLLAGYLVSTSPAAHSRRLLMLVTAVVVALSQQRSVWLAAMLGVLISIPLIKRGARAALALILILVGSAYALFGAIIQGAVGDAANTGTYDARVRSWLALLSKSWDSGFLNVAIGSPMGEGYGRFEGPGRWVEFAPHNFYLSLYLRAGILGLTCLIAAILYAANVAVKHRSWPLLAVVATLIVYGWTYSWVWYTLPLLALAWQNAARPTDRGLALDRQKDPRQSSQTRVPVGEQ